jgi:hypothetical protein
MGDGSEWRFCRQKFLRRANRTAAWPGVADGKDFVNSALGRVAIEGFAQLLKGVAAASMKPPLIASPADFVIRAVPEVREASTPIPPSASRNTNSPGTSGCSAIRVRLVHSAISWEPSGLW